LRVVGLLLLLSVLSALWVYSLLFRAVQTPVVVLAATDYGWPVPPNGWVREDVDRLGNLHGKTLYVVEPTVDWSAGEHALRDIQDRISDALARRNRASAVLIYLSMHGCVDGEGNPCLVPPGGSPLDAESWISVGDLLDSIKGLAKNNDRDIILVLDCNRLQTDWRLGLLYNSFADRLPEVVRQSAVPNLVVLNSAGPGQIGWTSAELRGSIFGHFLGRALAGEADADGDRRVSVGELHKYLGNEVNRWANRNRAASQEPMLIAEDGARQRAVAWVPAGGVALQSPQGRQAVSQEELRTLWKDHDELLSLDAIRFAPLEFQAFQNRLLWLEQLNQAGRAYNMRAEETRKELNGWVTAVKQRKMSAGSRHTVASRRRTWNPNAEIAARSLTPHSLPLAMHLRVVDENTVSSVRRRWTDPGNGTGPTIAADTDQAVLPELTESVFCQVAQRQLAWIDGDTSTEQLQAFRAVLASLERGEQVAVPDDERVAAWIQGSVAVGDRARRAAEDALSAGDFGQALENCRQADLAYERAEEFVGLVTSAFDLRDTALAEVPYLAAWLAGEPLSGQPEVPAAKTASPRLMQLVENLHALGEQLSDPDRTFVFVTPDTTPFAKTLESVREDFDWLRGSFDRQAMVLAKTIATPVNVRKLQAVLATPLIAAAQRGVLREELSRFETKLCQTEDGTSDGGVMPARQASSFEYLACLEQYWVPHPAVQLICPTWLSDPPAADPTESPSLEQDSAPSLTTETPQVPDGSAALRLARDGERIRRYLRELPNMYRAKTPVDSSDPMTTARGEDGWQAALVRHSRRARLARIAAAWCECSLNSDPVANRRVFDLQSLLLWHTERTLLDFRGPADGRGESFFRTAAQDYLDGVSQCGDAVPAIARRREGMQAKLDAAAFRLNMDVENVLLIDPSDPVRTQVRLRPDDTPPGTEIGTGRLALLVRSEGGRVAGVQFSTLHDGEGDGVPAGDSPDARLAFPLTGTPLLELQGQRLGRYGPRVDVVAAFRGHELAIPCLIQTIGGVTVDYRPPADLTTRVLVKGTRRQRKSFVFVLDCSESMNQVTGVEATDGHQILRMELAKNALQGMLDQLADEPDTRVGVRFFGHRVGWSTTEPVRVLRRKDYVRPIPLDLAPSDDVEQILPLGRFDSLVAGQVEDLLAAVQPWGQTPLYLALVDAIGDFERDDADTEKHIIVITDGVNYQFSPSASGRFAAPHPTTSDDVVAAWAKQEPAIHLVGFGIPEQDVAAAEREYRNLIDRTGGTYATTAADAQVLLAKLDQLLAKATYEVLDDAGQAVGVPIARDGSLGPEAELARLGEQLVIQPAPDQAREYTVACQQLAESILLRGGEAAEFELSADGRRLTSRAYLAGSPRFGTLIAGASGPPVEDEFGVHRPVIQNDGVRFEFSIQNPRRRFTPRPAEVWIEVTTVDAESQSAASAYTFYDAVFAADAPVPVIRWLAKGWPSGADAADVGCWFKMKPTPADVTIDASRVAVAPADRERLAEFPDVEFQMESISSADGRQIRVVEWHGENSAGVGSLKVDLAPPAGSDLQPARVIRTFDPDKRVAAHVFTLPGSGAEALHGWEIRLTAADSLRKDAVQLAKLIRVTPAENADQLPPLTKTNGR
jgi:hypothetical protein